MIRILTIEDFPTSSLIESNIGVIPPPPQCFCHDFPIAVSNVYYKHGSAAP